MKKLLSIFIPFGMLLSCSQLDNSSFEEYDNNADYSTIVMTVSDSDIEGLEPLTKNVAIKEDAQWSFVWSAKDSIGIFPDKGSQIYFSMASGAGQVSASFDGGGWALKKGSSYFSYFPFTPDFYIDKEAIPLTYLGQIQKGNADLEHVDLGRFGYMVAKGHADEASGSLYFNYEKLGLLYRIRIPVSAGTYKSLKVYTDSDVIIQSGTYNALNMTYAIENPVCKNNLSLAFEDLTFTEESTLVAFMMFAPFDYADKQITFELTKADGTKEISSTIGRTYLRDKVYLNAPHINISPSSIEIAGNANVFTFNILASGTHEYSVENDSPDWLTIGPVPGRGSATVSVVAAKNPGGRRIGHITVSETVNGVLLKNVVTVRQYADGLTVEPGEWEDSGEDYGGSAH